MHPNLSLVDILNNFMQFWLQLDVMQISESLIFTLNSIKMEIIIHVSRRIVFNSNNGWLTLRYH